MNKEKLFDLSQISEMLGDEEELRRMVGVFVESTPVSLNDMNEGFKDNDAEKVASNAHKMKASLDLLKIDSLYEIIRKIDKKPKVENIAQQELIEVVEKINIVLEEVFDVLKKDYNL